MLIMARAIRAVAPTTTNARTVAATAAAPDVATQPASARSTSSQRTALALRARLRYRVMWVHLRALVDTPDNAMSYLLSRLNEHRDGACRNGERSVSTVEGGLPGHRVGGCRLDRVQRYSRPAIAGHGLCRRRRAGVEHDHHRLPVPVQPAR